MTLEIVLVNHDAVLPVNDAGDPVLAANDAGDAVLAANDDGNCSGCS